MHSSGAIEHRELIGVVRRTGLEPCLNERGLTGETGAGHDDGVAFPANDAGVDEEMVRCVFGDEELGMCRQRLRSVLQVARVRDEARAGRHTK